MPSALIPQLQQEYFFHVWNESPDLNLLGFVGEDTNKGGVGSRDANKGAGKSEDINKGATYKEVRLMCSWDTTEEDIEGFVSLIGQKVSDFTKYDLLA